MRGRSTLPAAGLLALLLAACFEGPARVAGGGGVEVEGITVEGMALYPDHRPAAGARVQVRPWDWQKPAGSPKLAKDRADTVTDSLGRFTVDSLDPGIYAIAIDAGESGHALLRMEADGSRDTLSVEGTVWAGGTLSGRVLAEAGGPLAGVRVGLYGTDRAALTDSAGRFAFDRLAPGIYTLKLSTTAEGFAARDIPEVAVGAGSTVALDSLVLPRAVAGIRAQWRCDEGTGKVAADAAGSEARLILYGALWSAGREGGALDFPEGAYAMVPRTKAATLQIGAGRDFRLSAWIKADPSAGTGSLRIIADTRTSYISIGHMLGLGEDGAALYVARQWSDSAARETRDTRLAGGPRLDDGNWHLVEAGRSGGRFALNVDGAQVAEAAAPPGAITDGSPLYVGAREGKGDFFHGSVDDLRLLE